MFDFSGLNSDRFVDEDEDFSRAGGDLQAIDDFSRKIKQKYWTVCCRALTRLASNNDTFKVKQLFRTKVLGTKTDEHLCEADRDFDEKVASFNQLCSTTKELMSCIEV